MRIAIFLLFNVLALQVWANDSLWEKLGTEADLVVLMRHTQWAGGNRLTWDERTRMHLFKRRLPFRPIRRG